MKNKDVNKICHPCGITANYLTCLKKYGRPPLKSAFTVSTYHNDICDVCGHYTGVTEPRDFFHPDFELIFQQMRWDHECSCGADDGTVCGHNHCVTCISRNKNS